MKKLNKIMLTSGVMLALSTGVVTSYLMAQQPRTPQEDLTLANVEALSAIREFDLPDDGDLKFYFNGQFWERNPESHTANSWWPQTTSCRRPDGSAGGQVVCAGGGGNCWNGTSCI